MGAPARALLAVGCAVGALAAAQADEPLPAAMPALSLYAVGVVVLPVMAVNPPTLLAWPAFMLIAPPFQASFNARGQTLARALAETPLPPRIVDAIGAQWAAAEAGAPPWQVRLTLAAYGLTTRSGARLEAFEASEDLCLAADARLDWRRDGMADRREALTVGHAARSADAPPPLCTSMGRFAADDGRLLRQAIDELAEVLAAMVLHRLEPTK